MRTLQDSPPPPLLVRRALRHARKVSLLLPVSPASPRVVEAARRCRRLHPPPPPSPSAPSPSCITPVDNQQAASDTPTFTARNAQNYDQGQATYTFRRPRSRASGRSHAPRPRGPGTHQRDLRGSPPPRYDPSVVGRRPKRRDEVASSTATFRTDRRRLPARARPTPSPSWTRSSRPAPRSTISTRILRKCSGRPTPGAQPVVYDITSKPPSTIEWE